MSVLDENRLLETCRAKLRTGSDILPSIPLEKENKPVKREFEPGEEAFWLRETLLITQERIASTGMNGAYGELRYDVFTLKDRGAVRARQIARAIRLLFEPRQSLTDTESSLEIVIMGAEPLRPYIDDLYYIVPVSIRWRVYTAAAFST